MDNGENGFEVNPIEKLRKDIKKAAATLTPREARYLTDLYYQMQDQRIRVAGQVRSIDKDAGEEKEPHETLDWVFNQSDSLENSIRAVLGEFAKNRKVGLWSQSICGIGPVLSAGLIAYIGMRVWVCTAAPAVKIKRKPGEHCSARNQCSPACHEEATDTASRVWRYAGYDPTVKWEKGQKRPWNASLKVLCWKIGQSFVKVSNLDKDFYGKFYQQRKALEVERNEAGQFAAQAAAALEAKKYSKDTDAYKAYIEGKLPKAHIQARSERYAVKLFLSHWHQVAYFEAFGKLPPKPYVLDILGHKDQVQVPNWPF